MTVNEQKAAALQWLLDRGGGNGVWLNQLRTRWRTRIVDNPFSDKEWNKLVEIWGTASSLAEQLRLPDLPFDPVGRSFSPQELEEKQATHRLIRPTVLTNRFPRRSSWSENLRYWVEDALNRHYPVIEVRDDFDVQCFRYCPDDDKIILLTLISLLRGKSKKKLVREILDIYPNLGKVQR